MVRRTNMWRKVIEKWQSWATLESNLVYMRDPPTNCTGKKPNSAKLDKIESGNSKIRSEASQWWSRHGAV